MGTIDGTHKVKHPWTTDKRNYDRIIDIRRVCSSIVSLLEDSLPVIIVSDNGSNLGESFLLESDGETLTLEKPVGFNDTLTKSIQVYFQDTDRAWNFFAGEVVNLSPSSFSVVFPDSLYHLQRRKHPRITAPDRTTVYFFRDYIIHYGGMVKDLSYTGMLVYTGEPGRCIKDDSQIDDISIAFPRNLRIDDNDKSAPPLLINIKKGQVVRSFRDPDSNLFCHGISFQDKSIECQEKIELFVDTVRAISESE